MKFVTVNLVYSVEHPFRSLILISEDSPGGELYHNCKTVILTKDSPGVLCPSRPYSMGIVCLWLFLT